MSLPTSPAPSLTSALELSCEQHFTFLNSLSSCCQPLLRPSRGLSVCFFLCLVLLTTPFLGPHRQGDPIPSVLQTRLGPLPCASTPQSSTQMCLGAEQGSRVGETGLLRGHRSGGGCGGLESVCFSTWTATFQLQRSVAPGEHLSTFAVFSDF